MSDTERPVEQTFCLTSSHDVKIGDEFRYWEESGRLNGVYIVQSVKPLPYPYEGNNAFSTYSRPLTDDEAQVLREQSTAEAGK